jgi:hypothetical protein
LQELAGHSSPNLTARYSHRRLYDLAGAVDKLPNFLPVVDDGEAEALRATGTDASASVDASCSPVAQLNDTARETVRDSERDTEKGNCDRGGRKPLKSKAFDSECEAVSGDDKRVGDGTRTRDFQIHSLTL